MSKNTTNVEITATEADAIIAEGNEKFGYVLDKDPTPKQDFYATVITALTGVEVTPKQYQAMISTHRFIQASDLNRARADYRPRTAASVIKASETLLENASSLKVDDEGAVISKSATHIPEDLFAPGELARLAAEAQALAEGQQEAEEPETEEVAEEVEESDEDFNSWTKQELVDFLVSENVMEEAKAKRGRKAELVQIAAAHVADEVSVA